MKFDFEQCQDIEETISNLLIVANLYQEEITEDELREEMARTIVRIEEIVNRKFQ